MVGTTAEAINGLAQKQRYLLFALNDFYAQNFCIFTIPNYYVTDKLKNEN
jgi:hypothetical protein